MYFRTFVQHQRPTPLRNEGRRFGKRSPSFLKTKGIVFAKEGHRFLQGQALARIASPTPYYIYTRAREMFRQGKKGTPPRQERDAAKARKGRRQGKQWASKILRRQFDMARQTIRHPPQGLAQKKEGLSRVPLFRSQ